MVERGRLCGGLGYLKPSPPGDEVGVGPRFKRASAEIATGVSFGGASFSDYIPAGPRTLLWILLYLIDLPPRSVCEIWAKFSVRLDQMSFAKTDIL